MDDPLTAAVHEATMITVFAPRFYDQIRTCYAAQRSSVFEFHLFSLSLIFTNLTIYILTFTQINYWTVLLHKLYITL